MRIVQKHIVANSIFAFIGAVSLLFVFIILPERHGGLTPLEQLAMTAVNLSVILSAILIMEWLISAKRLTHNQVLNLELLSLAVAILVTFCIANRSTSLAVWLLVCIALACISVSITCWRDMPRQKLSRHTRHSSTGPAWSSVWHNFAEYERPPDVFDDPKK